MAGTPDFEEGIPRMLRDSAKSSEFAEMLGRVIAAWDGAEGACLRSPINNEFAPSQLIGCHASLPAGLALLRIPWGSRAVGLELWGGRPFGG
eukprot:CAMPEP_0179426388 /NCGR_PEP_ID=MMETSP0799-20121207/12707_1 /TAXON_ID=46947 /ORGANISM="Geminigera cryophila, Strain CCMP2564" /LENGTH=91 /DNA_ID=CAMNT_0021201127 /DNA_START=160 /DNA_END=435 /DNA_ORIENTATION=+